MTNVLLDVLGFVAKSAVVFITFAALAVVVATVIRRARDGATGRRGWLEVKQLNERFDSLKEAMEVGMVRSRAAYRSLRRQYKEAAKLEEARTDVQRSVYVLDFEGDILASATGSLREEVTAIAQVAKPGDEVVVRLESAGGAVPHYGLAAAQLVRLKDAQLKVTVCIDRIAASGGYLMACVADRVVAAPFSIIGSIGVVAQVPNIHRFLQKHQVDVEEMTAGEFKRTVSLFGEVTDKGKAKLQEQLEETHQRFKNFIQQHRPQLDLERVATGEYWLGTRAKELLLVDELRTSDEQLLSLAKTSNVFRVRFHTNAWRERLMWGSAALLERVVLKVLSRATDARFYGG